jgi:hypothetical protein
LRHFALFLSIQAGGLNRNGRAPSSEITGRHEAKEPGAMSRNAQAAFETPQVERFPASINSDSLFTVVNKERDKNLAVSIDCF